jgi:response regulator RpfG family c-di-GMP phosphodiesterase
MNDDFLFVEEDEEETPQNTGSWKILIVDDEPEIHAVTKLALSDFSLNGVGLSFLSAYSGEEAIEHLKEHPDIAVVLLDVVMETDDAGLIVANRIRNELDNHFTRIILRTGQPGQAPEKHVIVNYDINDYKSKTELTAQKLFTVIIAALRSYRDIMTIEESRQGLQKVITASTDLFSRRSFEKFVEGLIQQLSSVLGCSQGAAYITSAVSEPTMVRAPGPADLYVFAANGEYADLTGEPLSKVLESKEVATCERAISTKDVIFADDHIVAYCSGRNINGSLLYLSGLNRPVNDTDKQLIKLFSESVQVSFENIMYLRESKSTQCEIVERLCRAMDTGDQTSNHIPRLVAMSELLAKKLGMTEESIDRLKVAVPMHDVGNSQLPKTLLNKEGVLSQDEIQAMQKHTQIGAKFFSNSDNPTVKLAATLAKQHHERWDGTGYPNKLTKSEIKLESRILAAADVFDALYNQRPYKTAWPVEKVIELFNSEKNRAFDPNIVEAIINSKSELIIIQETMRDGKPCYTE